MVSPEIVPLIFTFCAANFIAFAEVHEHRLSHQTTIHTSNLPGHIGECTSSLVSCFLSPDNSCHSGCRLCSRPKFAAASEHFDPSRTLKRNCGLSHYYSRGSRSENGVTDENLRCFLRRIPS